MIPNRTTLLSLATAGLLSLSASAKILRVPSQFPTIQSAVNAAAKGDTIRIGPGIYAEQVAIEGQQKLTLLGKPGHEIRPPSGGFGSVGVLVIDSDRITLRGLRILGSEVSQPAIGVSDCNLVDVRNCVVLGAEGDGIKLEGTINSKIRGNRVESAGGIGIVVGHPQNPTFDSDLNTVFGNQVVNPGREGIAVFGYFNILTKNRVIGGSTGIRLTGDSNQAHENRIEATQGDAIHLSGTSHRVIRNKLFDMSGDGIDVESNSTFVYRNRIRSPGDDGLSVDSSSYSVFKRNRITGAADDGVRINAGLNTFVRNISLGSAALDLRTLIGESENVFIKNQWPNNNLE